LSKFKIGYFSSDYAQILEGAGENDLVILEVQGELKENALSKLWVSKNSTYSRALFLTVCY